MLRIKVTTNFADWPLARQTPGRSGLWGGCQFVINQEMAHCDGWIVYDDLLRTETTCCPPQNVILITGEPPSVKRYPASYTAQFGKVITCHRLRHHHLVPMQQGMPWMVGRRYLKEQSRWADVSAQDYDELAHAPPVPKTRLLSVLCSDKSFTAGHAARLSFVRRLQQHFGARLDVFGRGVRDVEDKWDALAPYEYHIVLENSAYPDYWTEKLADAYLAEAFPFYGGCPNLTRYFAADAFVPISVTRPAAAIQAIETALAQNRRARNLQAILQAKKQVLEQYQFFPMAHSLLNPAGHAGAAEPSQTVTLHPAVYARPSLLRRLARRVRAGMP